MIDGLFRRSPRPGRIRLLAVACFVAIAWLSLYPLSDWRLRQPSAFAFLSHGLPRFHARGDLFGNITAYLIFGTLATLAWFSAARRWLTPVLVVLVGVLMSLSFEALQSWLPGRVPSLLDVIGNVSGVVAGALLGTAIAVWRLRALQRPGQVSVAWYEEGPVTGWVLLGVWLLTQLPVQRLLFSTGHLPPALLDGLPILPALLAQLGEHLPVDALRPTFESLTIGVLIAGVGVLVMDLVRHAGARIAWITAVLLAAWTFRWLAGTQAAPPVPALAWLTHGAQAGMVIGALALYLTGAFGHRIRALIGLVLTGVAVLLVNLVPSDPYFQSTAASLRPAFSAAMTPGMRSLLALAGTVWPFAAMLYFGARALQLRPNPRRP